MPTDAIVIILIVAIVANLAIMGLLVLNLWQRRRPAAELAGSSPNPVPIAAPASAPPLVGSTPAAAAPEPVTVMSRPPVAEPPAPPELPEEPELEPSLVNLLVDPVTGLESHFAWDRELRNENARLRRYGRPYTIVVAELDGLDRLADRVGAEAAGRIVPAIGQVLRRQAREPDHVARTGPARFGVLLVETDEVRAINYVERVRAACDVWLQAGAVALQLSFGWASPGPDADTDAALLLAQERLQSELAVARRRAMAS
ncbi:MAG: diguanylate cyclase domain-containing protein [Solirubrobacteraceae bacterium]